MRHLVDRAIRIALSGPPGEVVTNVRQIAGVIAAIAAAGLEQETAIEQVNQALAQMDQVTQQMQRLLKRQPPQRKAGGTSHRNSKVC